MNPVVVPFGFASKPAWAIGAARLFPYDGGGRYKAVMADIHHPEDSADEALEALLDWYAAMGVDAVLRDEPVDRFAEALSERERRATQRPPTAPAGERGRAATSFAPSPSAPATARGAGDARPSPAGTAAVPSEEAVAAARAAAASAGTMEELKAQLAGFEGCNLRLTAKNLVFGDGNPAARLMFVGGAPGREEDIEGRAFAGPPGKLLDRMLAAMGMSRETDAYIGNVVFWRPPGDRDPSDQEVAVCRPFIERQIELVDPDLLVLLGGQAAKALIDGEAGRATIRHLRGKWMTVQTGARTIRAIATFHPDYLLGNPEEKRHAWRDLLAVKAALGR